MIHFFYENTSFKLTALRFEKAMIKQLIESERRRVGDINFIFCDDEYLLNINREYLGHDYYTDVITFDTSEENDANKISGDIFISIDSVKANGLYYGAGFESELARVMAHGVLHLLGYDDMDERSKIEMRQMEEAHLQNRRVFEDEK